MNAGRALALLALMAAATLPASALHPQESGGKVVAFDHKTGNAWWLEATVTGRDAASVTLVEAAQYKGEWQRMTHRPEWGSWSLSARFTDGLPVKFRATWADGARVESCWFSHPDGAEQCAQTPPPPPPPPGTFDATFSGVKGNPYWVEARVQANAPLAGVDARVGCDGAWRPLTLRSWASWAASFHIPDGSRVDFRARATSGATDLSGGYTWPQASPAPACGSGGTEFEATVSGVKGNSWWVEARVAANRPLAGVDARVDGGTWRPLTLRSWGAWAGSFHIPDGALVQFRIRAADGAADFPPNGWQWPGPTPIEAPPRGSTFDARFENVGGNGDWFQVNVYASSNWGLAGVSARIDGGAWQPLRQQAWGDWAAAIAVPDGSHVQFRAEAGATLVSSTYVWPSGRPVGPWPQPGSFARYELTSLLVSGNHREQVEATMHTTLRNGLWEATCEGRTTITREDGTQTVTPWTYRTVQAPRQMPTDLDANETANARVILPDLYRSSCELTEWIVRVEGRAQRATGMQAQDGTPIVLEAIVAEEADVEGHQDLRLAWETRLGLVLDWQRSGRMSQMLHYGGTLVDTDAPIR